MQYGCILKKDRLGSEAKSSQPWKVKNWFLPGIVICLFLGIVGVQHVRELAAVRTAVQIRELAFLPRGEYVKPLLLGYQQIAADFVWLRSLQVLGQHTLSPQEYEWLYKSLDLITTLDPHYAYAYHAGGVILTELAHRVDLSNQLLEKGLQTNPMVWQIPFYLGYNHLLYLHDYARAADYMAMAARLPEHPSYLPGLATRLYAEVGNIEVALDLLEPLWRQAEDQQIKEALEVRIKELIIERDIRVLEKIVMQYHAAEGAGPQNLLDLVERGFLRSIPEEPFGGEYRLDPKIRSVTSSTRAERLKIGRLGNQVVMSTENAHHAP